ncbi:MFS transporter [Halobellus salinisoli]|uniref:MFS transporter n=1 Tax=Halobellus salinisoli TaxID=3108500 RepID=UPI00300B3B33
MFGLTEREVRFAAVICLTHVSQHAFIRLLPPLIPVLSVALTYPLWKLGLLISVFYVGSGLGQAPLGVVADRYEWSALLVGGIVLSSVCYVVFAVAPLLGGSVPALAIVGYTFEGTFVLMAASMFVCGVGTAVVHPVGYPMITANVSTENKGTLLGLFGSSAKFGDAVAPIGVGVLILVFDWSTILVIFGGIGIAFGAILFVVLRGDEFVTAPTNPRSEASVAADEPADDRGSYRYPMVIVYAFFVAKMFASNGVNTFVPAFLVSVYGYTMSVGGVQFGAESVANFYFTALLVAGAVSQVVLGVVANRHDPRLVLLLGSMVGTLSLLALGGLSISPGPLLVLMMVLGVSLWGISPARDAIISEISPAGREGRTFGYFWTGVMLVGALMPVAVGHLIETTGMRRGFTALAVGTVLAAGLIGLLFTDRVAFEPRQR